jgi:hypothetical protein
MSVSSYSDADEVATCRNCGGTARRKRPGTYPVGWYGLTVSVPEWYREDGSDKQYMWVGMFCSPACLIAHGPKLQADADLAHQAYDPVIPTPPVRNPQGMRHPRQ